MVIREEQPGTPGCPTPRSVDGPHSVETSRRHGPESEPDGSASRGREGTDVRQTYFVIKLFKNFSKRYKTYIYLNQDQPTSQSFHPHTYKNLLSFETKTIPTHLHP